MPTRHLCASTIVAVVLLWRQAAALACMPAAWHPRQDAIILWAGGVEVVVWRTMVEQEPPPGARVELGTILPARGGALAWLLAVPTTPIGYEVVETADFEQTIAWASRLDVPPPPGGGGIGGARGIQVGPTVQVGEYDVTPITGTGAEAGAGLAAWLRQNGFPPAEPQAVQSYVAANATFLAVKARLPERTPRAKLRPLAIAFPTDAIVLPVKLSWREPPFGIDATIFSSRLPLLVQNVGHGFGPRELYAPGGGAGRHPGGPTGLVSIVPDALVPATLRTIANRMAARVPAIGRLQRGSLAVARIVASPVRTIDLSLPDVTIRLGDEVPPNAPAGVADGSGRLALVPPPAALPTPASQPAASPSPAAATGVTGTPPSTAPAATGCAVAGPGGVAGVLLPLAYALARMRRRGRAPGPDDRAMR